MKTLFRNGSIHTMNGTEVVHSLLVEDGRILDVNCDVPAGECQVVDLHGKTVLPGFHDSHEHFLCYATDKEKINFFGIRSLEEMAERTRRYIADRGIKKGEWIQGGGWNENEFDVPVLPSRQDLDKFCPDNPAIFTRTCCSVAVANTAALREPYEGDPENKGIFVYDEKVFYDLLEKAYRNGLQLAIHAIGDYTMDVILDCYEKIAAKYPKPDPRFRIIHCQITSEDILDRFARNGVLADIQPLFIRADMEIAEELLGKERVSTSYAWKTMLDKGIHVSGSSDAPVESFDPILAIHCAVTSQNLDGQPAGGWLPQQKLTVQEAVALYTTGSAYTSYEENVKGKLCPGYLADFIVLSQDIFSIPENEIVNTKVEQTYLGGKLVYSR